MDIKTFFTNTDIGTIFTVIAGVIVVIGAIFSIITFINKYLKSDLKKTFNEEIVPKSSFRISKVIDLREFVDILWYAKNGNGANVDFEVLLSENGKDFDTMCYHSANLGATNKKTFQLGDGIRYAKIKVTNNDCINDTKVTAGFYGKIL